MALPDERLDVLLCTTLIARHRHPLLDHATILEQLDDLAVQVGQWLRLLSTKRFWFGIFCRQHGWGPHLSMAPGGHAWPRRGWAGGPRPLWRCQQGWRGGGVPGYG
jgi:hypothetical protein